MKRTHRDNEGDQSDTKIQPIQTLFPIPAPIVVHSRTEAVVPPNVLSTLNRAKSFYERNLVPKSSTTPVNAYLTMLSNLNTRLYYERKSTYCVNIYDRSSSGLKSSPTPFSSPRTDQFLLFASIQTSSTRWRNSFVERVWQLQTAECQFRTSDGYGKIWSCLIHLWHSLRPACYLAQATW